MESAHSHHHLQDQLVGSTASSLATPSCYGLGTTPHAWSTPTSFLNTNGYNPYPSDTILNSRETRQQDYTLLPSHYTSSMAPDLGFNWANNSTQNFTTDQCGQDSRIKEELAHLYYRKYAEISDADGEQTALQENDLRTKLLLKSFSSGNLSNKIQLSPGDLYSNNTGPANHGRGFCQIFPSVNVSSLNQTGLTSARALDMNLEAVDLLASSRFNGSYAPSSPNETGFLRDGFSFGFDHIQQSLQLPFYGSNKVSSSASSNAAAVEAKRNSNKMEPKAQIQNAPKKSRLEARSSCPPFKVRKEKLGDRIAALQQLVAPFGKTDTASVLMEAIGYIKFLQNQVETLSVPYMKASRNKPNRVMKGDLMETENEEQKHDLKGRGLCLVPISCLSYIADGGGAAVWPPPHFGGAA